MSSPDKIDPLRHYKEKIYKFIKKNKDIDFFNKVYDIIKENEQKHTCNNNGVFFDVDKLNKKSIDQIMEIIDLTKNIDTTEDSVTYTPYNDDVVENSMNKLGGSAKLNNFEKNIIKKIAKN